jgi:hypothetical protein
LTVIHGQDYATDSQRAWAHGRLEFIGNVVGIKYASMLAELKFRIPSMLIRKDGLMNSPHPDSHNFVALLSAKTKTSQDYDNSPVSPQPSQPSRNTPESYRFAADSVPKSVSPVTPRTTHQPSLAMRLPTS